MVQGIDRVLQARDLALQLKMNDFYSNDFLFLQMQDKSICFFFNQNYRFLYHNFMRKNFKNEYKFVHNNDLLKLGVMLVFVLFKKHYKNFHGSY